MENRKFKYLLSTYFYVERGISEYHAREILYDNRKEVGLSYQLSQQMVAILKSLGLNNMEIALKEKRCFDVAKSLSDDEHIALVKAIEQDQKKKRIDVNHSLTFYFHKQIELEKELEEKKQR